MLSLLHIEKYLNILLLNPTCLTLCTINSSIFHLKRETTLYLQFINVNTLESSVKDDSRKKETVGHQFYWISR